MLTTIPDLYDQRNDAPARLVRWEADDATDVETVHDAVVRFLDLGEGEDGEIRRLPDASGGAKRTFWGGLNPDGGWVATVLTHWVRTPSGKYRGTTEYDLTFGHPLHVLPPRYFTTPTYQSYTTTTVSRWTTIDHLTVRVGQVNPPEYDNHVFSFSRYETILLAGPYAPNYLTRDESLKLARYLLTRPFDVADHLLTGDLRAWADAADHTEDAETRATLVNLAAVSVARWTEHQGFEF